MDIKSRQPKMRCNSLHQLVFKERGLPEHALLIYKLKSGPVLKQGYKQGAAILCFCCAKTFSPSQFEGHAGNGRRRQPYHNIYTSDGLALHELALKLQAGLNLNEISGDDLSYTDEDPDFASSSSSKESSTSDGPIIVPLKRTLQERSAKTESCHLCGDSCATLGIISEDMIVFCNQCERPCHIKCYNSGPQKEKALNVLQEYMDFHFLCCPNCKLFRDSLDNVLKKYENVTSPIQQKSNVGWQLLSGRNLTSRRQQLMTHQVTEIFQDAFPGTASDIIQEMVNAKDLDGEKDFRGMYCAVLTRGSKLVVSAAILKVRTEKFAELVLVATSKDFRKKGYFTLLLGQIEAELKALNVRRLMVPVDPEMALVWSEKFGFTILSDEEKTLLLEAHPMVMFEDLTLAKKSLAEQI